MIEQRAKGAWADILAADEPQRVEPLLTAFVLPNKLVKSVGCRKVLIRPCCVALPCVLVIFRAFPKSDGNYMRHVGDMSVGGGRRATAIDVLNRRLARGEIDRAEYDEKRKLIGR